MPPGKKLGKKKTSNKKSWDGPPQKRKAQTRPSPIKPKAIRTGKGARGGGGLYPADDLKRVRRLVESAVQLTETLRRQVEGKKLMATSPIVLGGGVEPMTSYGEATVAVLRSLETAANQVAALLRAAERDQDADRF